MALCRSRSGYVPFGTDRQEYLAYKFLTRITLCCLTFVLIIIILLYVSAYTDSLYDKYPPRVKHKFSLNGKTLKEMSAAGPAFGKTHQDGKFPQQSDCSISLDETKFDCLPGAGDREEEGACKARRCCWNPNSTPSCYYPKSYGGYRYLNVTRSRNGVRAYLERTFPSHFPNDVKLLRMDAQYQGSRRLRVKIYDAVVRRYEPPFPEIPVGPDVPPREPTYKFEIDESKTGFRVTRTSGDVLFDAIDKGAFIFADQFLQITAEFAGEMYGLGEHQTRFRLNATETKKLTLFNHDSIPRENVNLYGSHPFYMVVEPSGKCHGVLLFNSNAMDVILHPLSAVTFRPIGGILDFYFFTGPTPAEVVRQYTELVGRPMMPPYWSLGFHLSRLGYATTEDLRAVWERNRKAGIPFDTQWSDIDYMSEYNDFTYDAERYGNLSEFVREVHEAEMRYVVILDPGVSGCEAAGTYPPYDEGIADDVFVKSRDGSVFVGKVWNRNCTVFPDFTNPATATYWSRQIRTFRASVPFDGLWIDMNEPSNFLDGTRNGCPDNSLENPPYLPGVDGGKMYYKTVCMSSVHYSGSHYDLHNVYGLTEAIATNRALKEATGKRPFVLSRSTFPGAGRFAGHWSGDVESTWEHMRMTVPQLLLFSLFGVSMMGADICGFNGNATVELCQRWSQLGAFYPFARNHNSDDAVDQDPYALGPDVVESAKNALTVRYTLLPYLYTLFWRANKFGDTVARPLLFEFWNDANTHSADESFLWGCCVLIVPVLAESATTVTTYLPSGTWYDWYTRTGRKSNGTEVVLPAPLNRIPVLVRGGVVLPTQLPNATTASSRRNKMSLIAAYDADFAGTGSLYWDDGDELHADAHHGVVDFALARRNLTSRVAIWTTRSPAPVVGSVTIWGVVERVTKVLVNGRKRKFAWSSADSVLSVENLSLSVGESFVVSWS